MTDKHNHLEVKPKERERKRVKADATGKAVIGDWGLTKVVTDFDYQLNEKTRKEIDKEVKRLQKEGFRGTLVDVDIKIRW